VKCALALLLAAACVPTNEPTRAFDLSVPVVLRNGRVAMFAVAVIPESAIASPESLRRYLEQRYWWPGTHAKIIDRQNLRDGFATTYEFEVGPRQEHVVLQVGSLWKHCSADIADPMEAAEMIRYCREHAR
jgi:hypothetical protein